MILVFLGPKWKGAAIIFRLLAPTTLAFAILNPLGWLLDSLGSVERGLKIALVLGPVMIAGYLMGLHNGPTGVALTYSAVMILAVVPLVAWATHDTVVSFRDILEAVSRPLLSGVVAAVLSWGLYLLYGPILAPLPRLALSVSLVASVYLGMLLYVMGQKRFYIDLIRGLIGYSSVEERALVSG
jgi:PST family polysaccharide transporter